MAKYKMLWQSSTVIDGMPAYKEAIQAHGKKILGPDVELKVRGVKKGTSDIHYLSFDFLNNTLFFDSVVSAEKEGCDAVAIGCFLDPIIEELREIVDIPVMTLGEAAMLTACMLGKRFSIISYLPHINTKRVNDLVHHYGLSQRAAPFTHFDLSLPEMEEGFKGDLIAVEKFKKAAKEAVAKGADVLVPGCGCLNLILMNAKVNEVEGAPVLDISGALMKVTEMMIVLKKVSGTKISRVGYYESPPKEKIEEVLKLFGRGKVID